MRPVPANLHVDGAEFTVGADRADEVERVRLALARWGIDVRAVHRTGTGLGEAAGRAVYAELRPSSGVLWGAGVGDDLEAAAFAAVRAAVARNGRASGPAPIAVRPAAPGYARAG